MRMCAKNMRNIWYSYFRGETEVVDENFEYTGEYVKNYTNWFKTRVNYTVKTNNALVQQFGDIEGADLTIVTDKPIFTLETVCSTYPPDNIDIANNYEYRVIKVVKSLNSYLVGLKKRVD